MCPPPSLILSLFSDLTFVLSLSVCLLNAFRPACMASSWGSWVGDHCSSAVRSFPLIGRPMLVPVIQCLVDSLFAALLTYNSWCHAPLTFGVPCRCSAYHWLGVYVEQRAFVIRVCAWIGIVCFFGYMAVRAYAPGATTRNYSYLFYVFLILIPRTNFCYITLER